MVDDNLLKLDLYAIIGAEDTATEAELKKAYRQRALKCHPDKNPDNPKAAEEFRQLTKVLEILTDAKARACYDKVRRAKKEAQLRQKELSAKRKKFKDDLERREEAFKQSQSSKKRQFSHSSFQTEDDDELDLTNERNLKAEIDRLQKEGSRLVEEEQERLRQQIREEIRLSMNARSGGSGECLVKVNWSVSPDDEANGGYTKDLLHRIMSKHGEVLSVIISQKKGSALVEFERSNDADAAIKYELGLAECPLSLRWASDKTKFQKQKLNTFPEKLSAGSAFGISLKSTSSKSNFSQSLSFSSAPDIFSQQSQDQQSNNYEAMVLNKLKREQERKKLIEQMEKEDANT
ncbi:hypothetical protein TKK_0014408 [Trichogramma kaykai]|uniref:J domain-containing protein n=1 Tax=Trichogramma kaykai TaxID=54128 RepID=A0ABD2WDL7_9HYME